MSSKRSIETTLKMLCLSILVVTQSVGGAQCNVSSTETPAEFALQISHATDAYGMIYDQIVTSSAIYLSSLNGERVKINWN